LEEAVTPFAENLSGGLPMVRWGPFLVAALILCHSNPVESAPEAGRQAPPEGVAQRSGGFSYTVERISPTVQMQPVIDFTAPYYYFLLTNTAAVTDSFFLGVQNVVAPNDWFSQVCLRQVCFPDSTTLEFAAGASDTVGVNVVPFSQGIGTFEFYLQSVGDPGLNDTFSLTLYAGPDFVTGADHIAAGGAALEQNAPNPARASTRIAYSLAAAERVSLTVYDVAGRLVRTLADGPEPAGSHAVTWDGTDDSGAPLAGGVYYYRLSTSRGESSRRMTLLR
jgi:hypothetical protein